MFCFLDPILLFATDMKRTLIILLDCLRLFKVEMEKAALEGDSSQSLDPLPPSIPPNEKVEQMNQPKRSLVTRPGYGTSGKRISLLTNHLNVSIGNPDENFYQYSVK